MAGGGAGNEGHVDGDAVPGQLAGRIDGDVMDAADMTERIERRNIDADAHKFINIIISGQHPQAEVFLDVAFTGDFFRWNERHVLFRIKRQYVPFIVIETAKELHKNEAALAIDISLGTAAYSRFQFPVPLTGPGEQPDQDPPVAAFQPTSGRFLAKAIQVRLRCRQDLRRQETPIFIAASLQLIGQGPQMAAADPGRHFLFVHSQRR